ncbi:MAG: radical SAM protein, partial [Candidatus Omnitrophica bacterium]|nr:radical SAM protein [Candidatus Omnitrophota bacterium]
LLERILAGVEKSSEIILTGWGEPLLYPDIFKAVSLCKRHGLTARITTNGALLSSETSKRLVESGIDSINISVDSFAFLPEGDPRHRIKDMEENIKNLVSARKRKGRPEITLQPTLHRGADDDLREIIEKGKKIGADRINVVRLDKRFNKGLGVFNRREEREVVKKMLKLSKEAGIRTDILPFSAFTGLKKIFYALSAGILCRISDRCPKTYDYLYITRAGKVTPCCGLPDHIVGDISKTGLSGIWNGPLLKEFRKNEKSICAGCDVWKMT